MSNVLKVSLLAAIYSLHDKGWSQRRIGRELGLNRETVGRYLRLPKPAISTAGFLEPGQAKPAISTIGAMAGRKSQCEPLAAAILAKVEVGLSAQRIYQDLVEETGFADSYESVKRFCTQATGESAGTGLAPGMSAGRRTAAGLRLGSSHR
ncbi:MAG: helix-turn-helix domain-containing protein [Verrucomicrobia bacterium]|nr:helix-turn-helix domain-containing protein [Verrucomicrobiota bacterium]